MLGLFTKLYKLFTGSILGRLLGVAIMGFVGYTAGNYSKLLFEPATRWARNPQEENVA